MAEARTKLGAFHGESWNSFHISLFSPHSIAYINEFFMIAE